MKEIVSFAIGHKLFFTIMMIINMLLVWTVLRKISVNVNALIYEALGERVRKGFLKDSYISIIKGTVSQYRTKNHKTGIYIKAENKMKKSGYNGEYAPIWYVFLKYIMPVLLFTVSFLVNFPDVVKSFAVALIEIIVVEMVIHNRKRSINLNFQKNAYKIYKYLHNQISAGIKVTDALKTVYEVIDDKELKDVFIKLAAKFELTLDIDSSLDEFISNFDSQEAQSLCIALKQGVMTGDNRDLLARQEDIMFKKYFNYIQAETDYCKTRSVISAALFTAIIVIMIAVPLLNDVTDAVGKIFIN